MKTLIMVGTATPGTTRARVASAAKASGREDWPNRWRSPRTRFGGAPPVRNSGPGWNPKQMPA